MNLTWTPILANGLIMLEVSFAFVPALVVATGLALLAIVLATVHKTRKASRWLSVISLVVSLAPGAVLLWYAGPLATYGHNYPGGVPLWVAESLIPIALSAAAVWLSRRALPSV